MSRTKRYRPARPPRPDKILRLAYISLCPTCNKRCYVSKRAAKLAGKDVHPGGQWCVYRCGNYWHWGHLPRSVVAGDCGRQDIL